MNKTDEIRERKDKLSGYSPSPMSGPSWQVLAQQNVDIGTLLDEIAAKDAEIADLKTRLEKAVELPCKVGDTVFSLHWSIKNKRYEVCKGIISNVRYDAIDKGLMVSDGERYYKWCERAFPTREEAEAALEGMQNE